MANCAKNETESKKKGK